MQQRENMKCIIQQTHVEISAITSHCRRPNLHTQQSLWTLEEWRECHRRLSVWLLWNENISKTTGQYKCVSQNVSHCTLLKNSQGKYQHGGCIFIDKFTSFYNFQCTRTNGFFLQPHWYSKSQSREGQWPLHRNYQGWWPLALLQWWKCHYHRFQVQER